MSKDYEAQVATDESHIYVRVNSQEVTLELAESFTRTLTQLGSDRGLTTCLIDVRGARSVAGVYGEYQYAYERAEASGLTRNWRMAVLKDNDDQTHDFLQTVMSNAGRNFKLFHDKQAAVLWLKRQAELRKNA